MSKTKLTRKQIEEIVRQKVLQALNEETMESAGEEIDAGDVTEDALNADSDAKSDQLAKSFVSENEQADAGADEEVEAAAEEPADESMQENLTDKEWYDKSLYERLTRKWSK